ncbi:hypothetical protein B0F90DRAFT_1753051 [Multifurca ochricompacta]|uniref:F-box domain-containing protein n=1 Tax=Multifurca ochricompacta TaxID=376703 RepID=A0AAD4M0K2_9AGAM|nr:hypothetical protein B0F90DRAFT_1753051 [Multifurca ochricompacta]
MPRGEGTMVAALWGADEIGGQRSRIVDRVPENILLDIFDHHRLDVVLTTGSCNSWKWHRLAHVCRKWRSVVFSSPRRLELRLVYTYRKMTDDEEKKKIGRTPDICR